MSMQRLFRLWGLDDVLRRHRGLTISLNDRAALVLSGLISFTAAAPGKETISDSYHVEITVPAAFPHSFPRVFDTAHQIPAVYHRLTDGSFCLGSPARLRLLISDAPTLSGFIDKCVVPYLYGYSYFVKHGQMPFGELAHGNRGIVQDYMRMLHVNSAERCVGMLSLIGQKRRVANKQACPCDSGFRLGRCHHCVANRLRTKLGRGWSRQEATWMLEECVDLSLPEQRRLLLATSSPPRRSRKDLDHVAAAPSNSEMAVKEKAVA
jgi:hypothetical protein